MQSIQRLYRFIFLFLYFAILFFALFRYNKETKDKIDLTFESIACNCAKCLTNARQRLTKKYKVVARNYRQTDSNIAKGFTCVLKLVK